MLPGPSNRTEWERIGNGHLRAFVAELVALDWTVTGISASSLLSPSDADNLASITHIHWTESLTLEAPQPLWVKALTMMQATADRTRPHFVLQHFAQRHLRTIAARRPLVYQVHDLDSNWLEPARAHLLDRAFKLACLREAHAWVIHERSCLPLLDTLAAPPKHVAVCPLGDYARFHGEPIPRIEARRRFGWAEDETVFLYAGYAGPRRNPAATAEAFARLNNAKARLVVASRNAFRYLRADLRRVHVRDELLENETVRDLYCAADWIVMPGRQYLNSAVVRTALSYGRPVICIDFGSQSDMARDAALWLENESADALYAQLSRACNMRSEEYETYSREAVARHVERSWENSSRSYVELLDRLRGQAANAPRTSVAP